MRLESIHVNAHNSDGTVSVDAGASLGASLHELASEAAAVCTASNEQIPQRRIDSELSTIECKARRGSDAYYGLPGLQSESWFYMT